MKNKTTSLLLLIAVAFNLAGCQTIPKEDRAKPYREVTLNSSQKNCINAAITVFEEEGYTISRDPKTNGIIAKRTDQKNRGDILDTVINTGIVGKTDYRVSEKTILTIFTPEDTHLTKIKMAIHENIYIKTTFRDQDREDLIQDEYIRYGYGPEIKTTGPRIHPGKSSMYGKLLKKIEAKAVSQNDS